MLNRDYLNVLAVLIVAVCGLTSCVAKKTDTQSATADVPRIAFEKYTLPNGLDVILSRDARVPMVAVNLWYHVGPANEEPGRTGFAHLFEHMETAIVPGIYDPTLADEDIGVSTEEAHELTRRLAQDGLFVGISSGANLAGALRVARNTSNAVIVVVFCDGGEKYLSERFWDESTTPTLALQPGVERAIRAHGAETYPNECCGALYGRDGVVTATLALSNTTEEGPRRRFLVRPQDYTAAERRASELGADLLGFYHSHPDHPARPSQYDLDHAWPFFSYIIVSVRSGKPEAMTSWRLREDRSAFDPERLTYAEHH